MLVLQNYYVSLLNEDYLRAGFHISKRRSLSLPGLDDTTRTSLVNNGSSVKGCADLSTWVCNL